ncbi:hypothetical protein BZA05DRAFT_445207 [Tricharina praecox]|uniref:uncharacterized protein n=1 Tax=Tricharina praecox TaxID=43433 RepID=UPI00221FA749|nr:uncharacterized protein BZA05DRAFT_445207 [Tricharina praecox]KAI5850824.1 hypothetical protein BZA05DRAFT_445207 [Tricharina praecox]
MATRALFPLLFLACAAQAAKTYRDQCDQKIVEVLSYSNSSHYRFPDTTDMISGRQRVHLWACEEICGAESRMYPWLDIFQRITLWKVPLLLLIGNFQFAQLGLGNLLCVVCHLLGDPIDTMCSLLTKLEVSRRLYTRWATISEPVLPPAGLDEEARLGFTTLPDPAFQLTLSQAQDLAAVNAVFDDWMHSSDMVFVAMRSALMRLPPKLRVQFITAITEAAHKLSESRADDRLRAWLAILGYAVAIIAAFMRTLDQGPEKMTAHSIAFAMSMVWLVPAVMISTTAGGFTSKRAGMRIVRELQDELGAAWPVQKIEEWTCTSTVWNPAGKGRSVLWESTVPLGEALPWCGGNYSYRAFKRLESAHLNPPEMRRGLPTFAAERPTALLYFYSVLSVLLAVGCAMALSCLTSTVGLGCRTMTQMSFFLGWLLSVALTRLFRRYLSGKYHWYAIVFKDFIIGFLVIGFIVAAFIGKFNSCFCWSAYFSRFSGAYVEVHSFYFDANLRTLTMTKWPILVAVGLGGQAIMLVIMGWGNSQGVLLLFCREEKEQEEYFVNVLPMQVKTIERRCSETESEDSWAVYGAGRRGSAQPGVLDWAAGSAKSET